jgi:hypothetical protein
LEAGKLLYPEHGRCGDVSHQMDFFGLSADLIVASFEFLNAS